MHHVLSQCMINVFDYSIAREDMFVQNLVRNDYRMILMERDRIPANIMQNGGNRTIAIHFITNEPHVREHSVCNADIVFATFVDECRTRYQRKRNDVLNDVYETNQHPLIADVYRVFLEYAQLSETDIQLDLNNAEHWQYI